jgi:hypothetical protein
VAKDGKSTNLAIAGMSHAVFSPLALDLADVFLLTWELLLMKSTPARLD